MESKQKSSLKLKIFMLLVFLAMVTYGVVTITVATYSDEEPNYAVYITMEGNSPSIQTSGNLFGNDLWYPAKQQSGIIRIINGTPFSVQVNSLGVSVALNKVKSGEDFATVEESFLKNMIFTIQIKKLYIFNDTVIKNLSFYDLLYRENDPAFSGISLNSGDAFKVPANSYLDLFYTLKMSEESGDELEELTATVDFLINISEGLAMK